MKGRFEGWYYKHQANGKSLALIPGRADDHAFLQIVTDNRAYNLIYPLSEYRVGYDAPGALSLRLGKSIFSSSGVTLDVHRLGLTLRGEVTYGGLAPIRGDIMGPFRHFPMECRHGVISMHHSLSGALTLNDEPYGFTGGHGYIESDSGRSFPSGYTWVQCNDFEADCSIMAAVARIPFYGLRFWGVICVVWLGGREYRLATYRGVKIICCSPGLIDLGQGKYRLRITVDSRKGSALASPRSGKMDGIIRERLSCPARFRFTEGKRVLFDEISDHASYEYEM